MPPIVTILAVLFVAVIIMVLVTQKFPSHLSPEKMSKMWKFTMMGMLTLAVLALLKMCMGGPEPRNPYENEPSQLQQEQPSDDGLEPYVPTDESLPEDARVREI